MEKQSGMTSAQASLRPHRPSVLVSEGLPALVGGFTAAAASGMTIVPAVAVGAAAGAFMSIAKKYYQPK